MLRHFVGIILVVSLIGLTACGDRNTADQSQNVDEQFNNDGDSIFDLFNTPSSDGQIRVNRYLWSATLETLNFLPLESADPFTGIITYGFGTAPGSGRAFRATVLIQDPALDARSLKVGLQTRGGPASAEMTRAVENAILTRARQLRIRDTGL
ncbi:MAG: DUF3576 domain-containing protein [Pseudomonadota bacterium]